MSGTCVLKVRGWTSAPKQWKSGPFIGNRPSWLLPRDQDLDLLKTSTNHNSDWSRWTRGWSSTCPDLGQYSKGWTTAWPHLGKAPDIGQLLNQIWAMLQIMVNCFATFLRCPSTWPHLDPHKQWSIVSLHLGTPEMWSIALPHSRSPQTLANWLATICAVSNIGQLLGPSILMDGSLATFA